ncbi:hypothetical protein PEC18_05565 [Paucibacter sp. O1-1]|nr:hypothetical protein [Paucibacter sp. O1-1]MDA3825338.1 hypothetical protein [Paucibacter sp. O1-1]
MIGVLCALPDPIQCQLQQPILGPVRQTDLMPHVKAMRAPGRLAQPLVEVELPARERQLLVHPLVLKLQATAHQRVQVPQEAPHHHQLGHPKLSEEESVRLLTILESNGIYGRDGINCGTDCPIERQAYAVLVGQSKSNFPPRSGGGYRHAALPARRLAPMT